MILLIRTYYYQRKERKEVVVSYKNVLKFTRIVEKMPLNFPNKKERSEKERRTTETTRKLKIIKNHSKGNI